jgi:hypothetical protein
MKCPNCYALNGPNDDVCYGCRTPLRRANTTRTPQWAYLFAAACGIIPILTLGGAIPAMVGFGGAGGCLTVARFASLPLVLRLFLCVAITGGCWLLMAVLFTAVLKIRF